MSRTGGEMAESSELLLDDPWQVKAADFPYDRSDTEKLIYLVNYAALAPSILNSQPWTFTVRGNELVLVADRTRVLPVVDPEERQLLISCGAALCNLLCAMRSFGCAADLEIFPERDRKPWPASGCRRASLRPGRTKSCGTLSSSDGPTAGNSEERPLPEPLMRSLADAARREGAMLFFVTSPTQKGLIAELVAEAEREHLSRPEFRQELSAWITERYAEAHAHDGEAVGRLGAAGHTPEPLMPEGLSTAIAAAAARSYAGVDEAAEHQRDVVTSSPALALLTTDGDAPVEWVWPEGVPEGAAEGRE